MLKSRRSGAEEQLRRRITEAAMKYHSTVTLILAVPQRYGLLGMLPLEICSVRGE